MKRLAILGVLAAISLLVAPANVAGEECRQRPCEPTIVPMEPSWDYSEPPREAGQTFIFNFPQPQRATRNQCGDTVSCIARRHQEVCSVLRRCIREQLPNTCGPECVEDTVRSQPKKLCVFASGGHFTAMPVNVPWPWKLADCQKQAKALNNIQLVTAECWENDGTVHRGQPLTIARNPGESEQAIQDIHIPAGSCGAWR